MFLDWQCRGTRQLAGIPCGPTSNLPLTPTEITRYKPVTDVLTALRVLATQLLIGTVSQRVLLALMRKKRVGLIRKIFRRTPKKRIEENPEPRHAPLEVVHGCY